jgi:hypothetical protein
MFDFMQNFTGITMIIMIVPFILIALLFVWLAMRGRKSANQTKNWPTASGRILSADIQMHRDSDGSTPHPVITYSYRVMGKDYVGTRITRTNMSIGGSLYTPRVLERYPVDKRVDVFYNPDNPQEAVLEQGSPASGIFLLVAVIIGISLLCSVVMMLGMSGIFSNLLGPIMNSFGQ